jgi:amino acid adenylation domain-containing protein/non-ribosomal peptide synthase protein (TIGR01720 family)
MNPYREGHQGSDAETLQEKRDRLLRLLRSEAAEAAPSRIGRRATRGPEGRLSFEQEALWFLDKVNAGHDSYRVSLLIRFEGRLDVRALELTLRELVMRHEVLRTVYHERDGRAVAVVADDAHLDLTVAAAATPADAEGEIERRLRAEYAIPFDLARGPVARARLIRFDERTHCLLLMIHHIAADGSSVAILYQELCAIYASLARGERPALRAPDLQYLDFAEWQRERLEGAFREKQLAYWIEKLRGAEPLKLPLERAPAARGFDASSDEHVLSSARSDALRRLARELGSTLFITALTAFKMLLHRYSGQSDIVTGTPVTTRGRAELESMVGLLVNLAALRVDLSGDPTFRECLQRVQQTVLEANDHGDVPFDQVVRAVRPERAGMRNPLFQAAFALDMSYQSAFAGRRDLGGVSVSPVRGNDFLTHVDLEVYLRDTGDKIALLFMGAADLCSRDDLVRMREHYVAMLEAVASNPELRASELDLLTPTERDRLEAWSGEPRAYANDRAAHELFEEWAARTPDAIAVEFGADSLTYGELNARANRLARRLRRRGVGRGHLVGVSLGRGLDLVAALLAVFKAGAAYVPLDPKYPPDRLAYIIGDADLSLIVTDGGGAEVLGAPAAPLLLVDEEEPAAARDAAANLEDGAGPRDLAYVIYTSGSTGRPKGALLEHGGLCKVSAEQMRLFGAGPGSRVLQFSSPNFDASLFELTMALTTGGTLVLARQEEMQPGEPLARLLDERAITILTIPPSSLSVVPFRHLPALAVVNVAGEPCPETLVDRWAPGRRFFNLYGPTECTIWTTAHECEAGQGAPPIGRPIANTRVRVLDAQGRRVPGGIPGELCIGGVGVARGYLNRPELTRERFIADAFGGEGERLYRTGDKVRFRPDGALEFLGRLDRQVKVRGYRVELGEVEAALCSLPGVEAAVVAVQGAAPAESRLVAYVVPAPGHAVAADALRAGLQERLPAHLVPSVFVSLASLPLTPNGKIDHAALPKPSATRGLDAAYVAPEIGLEAEVAAAWKEVLGVEHVGIDDNFFDLGGHSLLLVKVHERLKSLATGELPVAALFEFPTVRSLAAHLARGSRAPEAAAPEAAAPEAAAPESGTAIGRAIGRVGSAAAADAPDRVYRVEPLAVVGMAGRFPGAADVDEYWRNLRDGVESVRFFSKAELRAAGWDSDLVSDPAFVPAKGYLEGADLFDAGFFGYSPREAELIDPQQRLFLECAWDALESTGYDPDRFPGQIGVFAGSSLNTYQLRLSARSGVFPLEGGLQGVIGNDKDFLPTRVSYKLNLRGPSVNVQTACSTSLVAVHEACRSLLTDECDMALAGGVSVNAPLVGGYLHEAGSITSPDGHCRAFDANGAGIVGGNGVGVVVLKRLSRALADGDTVHAVVLGSAVNNDGSIKVGYTAPSVEGQSAVVARALEQAGAAPGSIDYIEAHGTGTKLGDPIEIAALDRVFQKAGVGKRIAIGSVKTNFGHLDAAAGVAGFIKAVLALEHGQIPPSLHYERPNPELQIERTSFYVNSRLADWVRSTGPRRAGVSSFGIGGTNVHVVLEEPPEVAAAAPSRAHELLVLSARTPQALDRACANLAGALRGRPDLALADIAFTLQTGRKRFKHARSIVCRGTAEAIERLEQAQSPGSASGVRGGARRPVAFMFPGQGSQHVGMARGLYESEPSFRSIVDECAAVVEAESGVDLCAALYPDSRDERAASKLTETLFAQPALFTIEYALARLLMQWGVAPAAMIGHSVGEYVAACLAGVIERDDALRLVALRARLMGSVPPGAMLAVPLPAAELEGLLGAEVSIAAVNAPSLTVLAGPHERVAKLQAGLAERGIEARALHTSHAFHSSMMEPILAEFVARVAAMPLRSPSVPYLSNVTGDWITAEQATDPAYYGRHLRETVRFGAGLERLFEQSGIVLLDVGPGRTLSTLAKRHPARPAESLVVAAARHPEQQADDEAVALEALGELWVAGVEPDWRAVHRGAPRRRVPLPTYPFERERYWAGSDGDAQRASALSRHDDLADWIYVPSWRRTALASVDLGKRAAQWLLFTPGAQRGAPIEEALRAGGATVATVALGGRLEKLGPCRYAIDPARPEQYSVLLRELAAEGFVPGHVAHAWALADGDDDAGSGARIQRGFSSLIYAARALEGANASGAELVVLTDGVHDIDGRERLVPEEAMALGACAAIRLEQPGRRVRCIDLAIEPGAALPAKLVRLLADECCASSRDDVVAYRGQHRWVRAFEHASLAPAAEGAGLRRAGVYSIIGGLGAMGLELADYLARTASAKLVLVCRGAFPERGDWDAWLREHGAQERVARKIRRLRDIEAAGGEVLVTRADAADPAALRAVIAAAEARFGALHGVIHAAGAEKQIAPIESLDEAACADEFRPKLEGLRALEEALAGRDLDFCVVSSSLASVIGVMGGAAYSAAHNFIDAFVARRNRTADQPWIAINWDNWRTSEDDASGERTLAEFHLRPHEATQIFARILSARAATQFLVSSADLQGRIERAAQRAAERATEQATERLPSGAAEAAAARAHARPALSVDYAAPRTPAEAALAEIWCAVLGIDRVGVNDNFFELGGDSVLSIQIIARATRAGFKLTPKQAFEHQTIAQLAAVARAADTAPAEEAPAAGPVALTPIQRWFFERFGTHPNHFNLPMLLEVRRPLREGVLEQALQRLAARHEALRLRYAKESGAWAQRVLESGETIAIERIDLAFMTAAEQDREVERHGAQLQRSLDLVEGPLVRAAYFDLGANRAPRLLLVLHHLVVDIVSWGILLEDLEALCAALDTGREPSLPPKTASLKRWSEALCAYAQAPHVEAELESWQKLLGHDGPAALPDLGLGPNSAGSTATIEASLGVADTRALAADVPRVFGASVSDALLVALAEALACTTDAPEWLVDIEGHGREDLGDGIDVSRTVGWFTTLYPALLARPADTRVREKFAAMAAQMAAIPGRGFGFGALRYLANDPAVREAMRRLPRPQISFLYAGQLDRAFRPDALFIPVLAEIGPARHPEAERAHLVEINCGIREGQFRISWTFSANRHCTATIEALAEAFIDALKAIVDESRADSPREPKSPAHAFTAADVSADDLLEILRQQGGRAAP